VAIAVTYLLMGLVVSSYGPLLEPLSGRFGISLPVAGSIISVHFFGGLIGVLVAMRTLARRAGRLTVMVATAVVGAGCAAVAVAPTWPLFLGAVFVIGLGFGALVISLNQLVAYSEGKRRAALLNGLNAAYSSGAVIGPVTIAAFAQQHFSLMFLLAAAAAVLLLPGGAAISGRLPVTGGGAGRPGLLVGIFICAFIFYVGIENGAGGWVTSHLESTGLSLTAAATATSGFWLALVTGRLLITLVPPEVQEGVIVIGGSVVATGCLFAATIGPLAPVAYVLTGLAIAPIFPTGIVWLARLRPGDARATSWLYPAASVGGIVGPGAIGIVIAEFGVRWAPVVLTAVAVLMTASFVLAARAAVRRPGA
jgi:MFS transporter, FHS family, glucose/mannose:H+ symporter